jgi:hypothetical protein
MTDIAPRLAHNKALAEFFGLGPTYPAVTKQLEALPFFRKSLRSHGYNPSIIRFGERVLMAYRWHPNSSWHTRLAMAELDDKWNVISNKDIDVGPGRSMEDPHLFVHENKLWISWVESIEVGKSIIKYGQLVESKGWIAPAPFQPKYGRNDGTSMEKGWVPYSQQGEIHFIYSAMPDHIVIKVDGGNLIGSPILQPPLRHWPWGQIKGGTSWFPHNDTFIRFFHSTLDNENNPDAVNNPARRYYVGVMSRSRLASKPLLYGTEASDLTEMEKTSCRSFKSNVVFVSGAIALPDGGFALSVGINDSQIAILRVKKEDLNL